ncbi:MAG: cobalamin biosynthesis protein CbiM, partial [Dehalococcoidia bacterium]|nr:cobalamin biosynthesis protein CbiM [Dehalococcoidia bacterium]
MSKYGYAGIVVVGLAIAVAVALFSPLASSHPDGLERVAEDKEFIETAEDSPYEIIPDYTFPGVDNEDLSTVLPAFR